MKYAVGMDGGGTKTEVVIADEFGNTVQSFTSGAINYNGTDEESVRRSFQEMMDQIAHTVGDLHHCQCICIGAAGVSNPSVAERIRSVVKECGYTGDILIQGDHETALYGAHGKPDGVILIAGTGSICYGKNASGETHRTGGFGYLIDDEGSGYSIGRDLLSAVVRASDGRIPPTVITELVYDRLRIDSVAEIVRFVYDKHTNKKDIAALAPILTEACLQGDQEAINIAAKSAKALAELAGPVLNRLSMQDGVIAMAGSVLLKNSYIQDEFMKIMKAAYPEALCITPKHSAAVGAVMMALEHAVT